jgi:hypothetical protein
VTSAPGSKPPPGESRPFLGASVVFLLHRLNSSMLKDHDMALHEKVLVQARPGGVKQHRAGSILPLPAPFPLLPL